MVERGNRQQATGNRQQATENREQVPEREQGTLTPNTSSGFYIYFCPST
ncbi:MAG: hypothetical protein AB4426_32485 [Xenococcaceae cyanobacterium]